jgi:hypothetical protein
LLASTATAASNEDLPLIVYGGVNGGIDLLPKSTPGSIFGVQASVSKITILDGPSPLAAWGAFVDAAYVTNRGAGRFSIGPQAAFLTGTPFIVGIQPGFLTVIDHGRALFGFSLTPALTLVPTVGWIWLYGRWDHEFSGNDREDSAQFGLMVQFPLNLLFL